MVDLLLEPWRRIPTATVPKPQAEPERLAEVATAILTSPVILNTVTNSIAADADLRAVRRDLREGRIVALPSRITDKLARATQLSQDRVASLERRLDAQIERDTKFEARENEVFGLHDQLADALTKQYDAIERAYDILGNGSGGSGDGSSGTGS